MMEKCDYCGQIHSPNENLTYFGVPIPVELMAGNAADRERYHWWTQGVRDAKETRAEQG